MSPKLQGNPAVLAAGPASPDPRLTDRVREIMLATANTVSAMKIFPSEHASVRSFIDDLARKLRAFLDDNGKLEIGIEEYAFMFGGKPVYRDEMSVKSLPFKAVWDQHCLRSGVPPSAKWRAEVAGYEKRKRGHQP